MSKKQEEQPPVFSPRSAASLKREAELKEKCANIEQQIERAQRSLAEEEKRRDNCQRIMTDGRNTGFAVQNLDAHLLQIQALHARLEMLRKMKFDFDANIEAECVIPPDRTGLQAELAALVRKRLELDATIEKLLDGLRAALVRREEQTTELRGLAERIEFRGDFDERRFTALRNALQPVLPLSERWCGQLLGTEGSGLVRAVARVRLTVPEQLCHPGAYDPGEQMLLSTEQFEALRVSSFLDHEESVMADEFPKRFTPRQVVSFAQYQKDQAAAKASGISVEDFWRGEDRAEYQERLKEREIYHRRKSFDRQVEHYRTYERVSLDEAQRRATQVCGARP